MLNIFNLFKKSNGSGSSFLLGVHDQNDLQKILEKERARSDRTNNPFSLLVIDLKQYGLSSDIAYSVYSIINNRLRKTDETGWYNSTSLGIVLPETDLEGACGLLNHICQELRTANVKDLCTIYTYPYEENGKKAKAI